jgi:hypothetical protein
MKPLVATLLEALEGRPSTAVELSDRTHAHESHIRRTLLGMAVDGLVAYGYRPRPTPVRSPAPRVWELTATGQLALAEADVLDSLRGGGPWTLADLVDDTGRAERVVEGACRRLVVRGEAVAEGSAYRAAVGREEAA